MILHGIVDDSIELHHLYSHFENTYWMIDDEVFYSIIVEADMILTDIQDTPNRKEAVQQLLQYIEDEHSGDTLELIGLN